MIIMKFGGTSIAAPAAIRRVCQIIASQLDRQPIIVNSAMGKTTRNLLDIAHLSAAGETQEAKAKLSEIIEYHHELAENLIPDFQKSSAAQRLSHYFSELEKLLLGMSVLQDLTPRSLDKFLSYGELMSTAIIYQILSTNGILAELADAREFIVTDNNFGSARPVIDETYSRIRKRIQPSVQCGRVPVVQGYIAATRQGVTTTMGFEGSDLTASLLGAALKAEDIQIWKDVCGIMTADPQIISTAYTIRQMSYEEAGELTMFGAKVLHPSSIEPALRQKVPVHVFNSRLPKAGGTEIVPHPVKSTNLIKSIAYKRKLGILSIRSNRNLRSYDFIKSVFDILDRERLVPYVTTTTESHVSIVLQSPNNLDRLIEDIKPYGQVKFKNRKATVTIVGENLKSAENLNNMIFGCISNKIYMIGLGASPINFTLVIDEKDVEQVIQKLHQLFFKEIDEAVFTKNK